MSQRWARSSHARFPAIAMPITVMIARILWRQKNLISSAMSASPPILRTDSAAITRLRDTIHSHGCAELCHSTAPQFTAKHSVSAAQHVSAVQCHFKVDHRNSCRIFAEAVQHEAFPNSALLPCAPALLFSAKPCCCYALHALCFDVHCLCSAARDEALRSCAAATLIQRIGWLCRAVPMPCRAMHFQSTAPLVHCHASQFHR